MTPIVGLFLPCRPAAIAGLVVAAVVWPAVEGGSGWAFAHVGEEIVKGQPAITDGNPALAIPLGLAGLGVESPLLHGRPRPIGWRDFPPPRARMAVTHPPHSLVMLTATTDRMPAPEVVADDDDCFSAVAKAPPAGVGGLHVGEIFNGQAAETLPCEIAEDAHV